MLSNNFPLLFEAVKVERLRVWVYVPRRDGTRLCLDI